MTTIGLDIGGAAIKLADSLGNAHYHPFPLWKRPSDLGKELADSVRDLTHGQIPQNPQFAITMTGELCDCFETRVEGVTKIVDASLTFARNFPVYFWSHSEGFVSASRAKKIPLAIASANWHAQALFVSQSLPTEHALLIDVGSTTMDLIKLRKGEVRATGKTDFDRLSTRELLYRGVRRTPIHSILQKMSDSAGNDRPVIPELFATVGDAFIWRGDLAESTGAESCEHTADGRPATKEYSRRRLARAIGLDYPEMTDACADSFALQVASSLENELATAIELLATELRSSDQFCFVVSGEGEFLARKSLERFPSTKVVSLSELLGPKQSQGACAYAVASLLANQHLSANSGR